MFCLVQWRLGVTWQLAAALLSLTCALSELDAVTQLSVTMHVWHEPTLDCFRMGSCTSLQAWQRIAASIDMQMGASYSKWGSRMSHLERNSAREWF